MDDLRPAALEILEHHGIPVTSLEILGAGEQSICYGTGDYALLIGGRAVIPDVRAPNPYPLQQWMTAQSIRVGARTAAIEAVGDRPYPYALMRRAYGVLGTVAAREASEAERAGWFRRMGAEVRKINTIRTEGFGEFIPTGDGGYRGRHATWNDYLDACIDRYLKPTKSRQQERNACERLLEQGILSEVEMKKIATRLNEAKGWGAQSVLIHYDNRLANLIVDGETVTLLDWGLAYAGIGLPQELIKVTEAPPASPEYDPMSAFLAGYGLPQAEWAEAIERGVLMLVPDGLAMSAAWAESEDPAYLGGVHGWLRSIKGICAAW